jgi:hypothetical protein
MMTERMCETIGLRATVRVSLTDRRYQTGGPAAYRQEGGVIGSR